MAIRYLNRTFLMEITGGESQLASLSARLASIQCTGDGYTF